MSTGDSYYRPKYAPRKAQGSRKVRRIFNRSDRPEPPPTVAEQEDDDAEYWYSDKAPRDRW